MDLDFVDFGDCEERIVSEVFSIKTDFLRLKFQAVQCSLAKLKYSAVNTVSYTLHSTHCTAHCTLHTVHCTLHTAHCRPAPGCEWSEEAIAQFESLSHCAQWKVLWAKVMDFILYHPPH